MKKTIFFSLICLSLNSFAVDGEVHCQVTDSETDKIILSSTHRFSEVMGRDVLVGKVEKKNFFVRLAPIDVVIVRMRLSNPGMAIVAEGRDYASVKVDGPKEDEALDFSCVRINR